MIQEVQITADSYDQIAPYVLHLTENQREGRRISRMWMDRFLDASLVPGSCAAAHFPILDLGCGDGRDLELFKSHGIQGVGMDVSRTMLQYARRRQPYASLVRMDMMSLGWKPRSFGGVWASGVIYHVPRDSLGEVVECIRRTLVPGGVFYFNYLVGSGEGMDQPSSSSGGYPRFFAYYQPLEIKRILKGFHFLSCESQHRKGFGPEVDHVLAVATAL